MRQYTNIEEARQILGIEPGADRKAIRRKAMDLLRDSHPDKVGADYDAEAYRKITEAREVLLSAINKPSGQGLNRQDDNAHPRLDVPVYIDDTDLSLIYALEQAGQSSKAGRWLVRKSDLEINDWIPETVYIVERDGTGNIRILKTLKDFVDRKDWDEPLAFVGKQVTVADYIDLKELTSLVNVGNIDIKIRYSPLILHAYIYNLIRNFTQPNIEGISYSSLVLDDIHSYVQWHSATRYKDMPEDHVSGFKARQRRVARYEVKDEVYLSGDRVSFENVPMSIEGAKHRPLGLES